MVFRIIVLRKIHFLFVLGKIFSRPVSAPLPIFCFPVNAMTIYTCTGRFDDKKTVIMGIFRSFIKLVKMRSLRQNYCNNRYHKWTCIVNWLDYNNVPKGNLMTQLREVPLPLELRHFLEVGGLFAPLGKIFPIFSTLRQCSTNSARRNILKLFISFVSMEFFASLPRNRSLAIKSEKSFSLCAFDIYPFK